MHSQERWYYVSGKRIDCECVDMLCRNFMNKRNQHEKGPPKRAHTKADGCRAKGMAGWMFFHFFFVIKSLHWVWEICYYYICTHKVELVKKLRQIILFCCCKIVVDWSYLQVREEVGAWEREGSYKRHCTPIQKKAVGYLCSECIIVVSI